MSTEKLARFAGWEPWGDDGGWQRDYEDGRWTGCAKLPELDIESLVAACEARGWDVVLQIGKAGPSAMIWYSADKASKSPASAKAGTLRDALVAAIEAALEDES